jgi:hypothetical protein
MLPTTLSAFLSSDLISFSGSSIADNSHLACFFIAFAIQLFTIFLISLLALNANIVAPLLVA